MAGTSETDHFLVTHQNQAHLTFGMASAKACDLLVKGAIYKIGNGVSIDIWKDPWVPNCINGRPSPLTEFTVSNTPHIKRVCQLLNPDHTWNSQIIHALFQPITAQRILSITIVNPRANDRLTWSPCLNRQHTTKSAYHLLRSSSVNYSHPRFTEWAMIWRSKIHARHKLLLWKIIWNILPTATTLAQKFHIHSTSCLLCFCAKETHEHIFLHCPFTVIVWSQLKWALHMYKIPNISHRVDKDDIGN